MSVTLYVEGSLDPSSGVAGWGASLSGGAGDGEYGGVLPDRYPGSTLMELAAVERAIRLLGQRSFLAGNVTLALRSTAAIAVLRWVFPEAPFTGTVDPAKTLARALKESRSIYDLHEEVERLGLNISLLQAETSIHTAAASHMARIHMEHARAGGR